MQVLEAMDGVLVVRMGRLDVVVIDDRSLLVWRSTGQVLRRWRTARA